MKSIDVSSDRKLIYNAPSMQRMMGDVELFAPSDISVIITGANGTGKENVARLIHSHSKRKDSPFVALNCAAIAPGVIESELFGHEKGAFTGANTKHEGAFERAAGGTLFLDEIGEMPPEMQTKLLRVLQDGEYTRVGGNGTMVARPRIIAATNRDIAASIKDGKLREDLYYRLRGVEIDVPDLKNRVSDIPILARHFVDKTAQKYELKAPIISDDALSSLMEYSWLGNVRELENRIAEATFRAQASGTITPDELRMPEKQARPKFTPDGTPVEDTLGYKISSYREERGWTQVELAKNINRKNAHNYQQALGGNGAEAKPLYTDKDVQSWESNALMPDRDAINTLAYLLIVNTALTEEEKTRHLVAFYEAAEHCQEAAAHFLSNHEENDFGAMVRDLREKMGMTQQALAEQACEISHSSHLTWRDMYMIENNHPERRVTAKESLALVKALDTQEQPLSPHDKLGLYEGAKRSFARQRIPAAAHSNGTNGKASEESKTAPRPGVDALLQQQRFILAAYFVDDEQTIISSTTLAEQTGLRPQVISSLVGRSRISPADVSHALDDSTCDKLVAYLKSLGKGEAVLTEFKEQFAQMKQLASNRQGSGTPGTRGASIH